MDCPKCGKPGVWTEENAGATWLRCTCGLMKEVFRAKGKYHVKMGLGIDEVKLPRNGTQEFDILMAVASIDESSTEEISDLTCIQQDKVGQTLRLLEIARLIELVRPGQGIPGGSIWRISSRGKRLIEV